ncbi:EutN/CcmL family microcompartment protein [Veillonella sp.]|uniref:EutN/CcmL family microcompartment protein n=1 Tax=Veillonella sp. TaxID=1926307 RepID=UPI0025D5FE52|nr:EutN/CcmL family microcompartment protein [Veillonella sp.]
MLVAKVIGSLWSTRKDEKLNGWKFMIVRVLEADGTTEKESFVAADNAGAGIGDTVLVALGEAARISAENSNTPIDAMIVGVIDSIDTDG